MRKIKKYLLKIWNNLLGKQESPRFHRYQTEFRKRYPNFHMGKSTYGIPVVRQWDKDATLFIGAYCSIARNVQIFLGGNHRTDWVTNYPFPAFYFEARHIKNFRTSRGDVVIGNDVWLCENCTILSGVKIGHGAVIASGAVISRDVEPYAVMAGNPAKLVRWRFDEETRMALLKAAWWDWPEQEVLSVVDLLCSDNLKQFLNYMHTRNKARSSD